jgi:hypothetical protein
MPMLTSAEIAAMIAQQQESMMDTCTLRVWNPTIDDYGTEVEGWVYTTGVACGLDVTPGGSERRRADGTIYNIAARLRLSFEDGEGMTAKDSVIVTHKFGTTLSPTLTYGVDGPPERGPTCVNLSLVRVA